MRRAQIVYNVSPLLRVLYEVHAFRFWTINTDIPICITDTLLGLKRGATRLRLQHEEDKH